MNDFFLGYILGIGAETFLILMLYTLYQLGEPK